jgi:hypothetical protein
MSIWQTQETPYDSGYWTLIKTGTRKIKERDDRLWDCLAWGEPHEITNGCDISTANLHLATSYGVEASRGMKWFNARNRWKIGGNKGEFSDIFDAFNRTLLLPRELWLEGFPTTVSEFVNFHEWASEEFWSDRVGKFVSGLNVPQMRDFIEMLLPPPKDIPSGGKIKAWTCHVYVRLFGTQVEDVELVNGHAFAPIRPVNRR